MFRLVHGILADWHHSEDVCQDVFTTVHRKLPGFQNRSQFSTWLYRVTVNAAIKARRKRRRCELLSLDLITEPPGKQYGPPEFEGREVFTKLLRPIPEKLRVTVVLRELGELSYDEIAQVLNCSRGAVEQRLHRAMTQLRRIWRPLGPYEQLRGSAERSLEKERARGNDEEAREKRGSGVGSAVVPAAGGG